jgi:segregation and condensation protein A
MTDHGGAAPSTIVPPDLSGWEDPPRRLPASSVPVLSVEGFEGPLDWLLEMVRARKIDLARLSIVALVEAFASALETELAQRDARSVAPLWRWGDWLVMAANLALLRSRLLLPVNSPEASEAHAEAEVLRRRLADRAQTAAAADWCR